MFRECVCNTCRVTDSTFSVVQLTELVYIPTLPIPDTKVLVMADSCLECISYYIDKHLSYNDIHADM